MDVTDLLKGAYDLHVHTGPDVMPRKLNDLEMAARIQQLGMKGYAIKSHYCCTAGRAKLVNTLYPNINVIGTICLNNAVGGLNPIAVEMAARDGAKIIWMPTFDSSNEQDHFKSQPPEKLPHWAKLKKELTNQGRTDKNIRLVDENGLKNIMHEILDIIAQHNLVLATGHISKEEIFLLVTEAKRHNVKKIVVTHPNFPSVNLSNEEQKKLSQAGAYMEYCFTTPHSNKTTWEEVYQQIRCVGARNCIISTDLGQPAGMYPDEGMQLFVANLLSNGFDKQEIHLMAVENPVALVEF